MSLEKKEFNNVILDFNDSATKKSDVYWSLHRIDSLTKLDLKTYHVIDSIGEKNKFDKKFEILQTLFENKIPINPLGIDLDIDKFFDFNEYENFRLGVGAHTNDKISGIFASFDQNAFASASVAQVHRATLKTGEQVVVKIQRQGIKQIIECGPQKVLSGLNKRINSELQLTGTADIASLQAVLENSFAI